MNHLIALSHGNGGRKSHELLNNVVLPCFGKNNSSGFDSAIIRSIGEDIAFTTDSFVITPRFFPGGDIGKLAVCGTINDLSVCGAKPLYLSCSLIIEDGFSIDELRTILNSMAITANENNIKIITGDTKVVEKGSVDGLFINTSGIGSINQKLFFGSEYFEEKDAVIVTGNIGDHGMTIFTLRNDLKMKSNIQSDCSSVYELATIIINESPNVRIMRDPTRGGLATILNEFVEGTDFSIELIESNIPVSKAVKGLCEMLGMDPLYIANEGKIACIVSQKDSEKVLKALRLHPLGQNSSIIGYLNKRFPGTLYIRTTSGGERILQMLSEDLLPRIC